MEIKDKSKADGICGVCQGSVPSSNLNAFYCSEPCRKTAWNFYHPDLEPYPTEEIYNYGFVIKGNVMSFYCNSHGVTSDNCSECLDKALELLQRMVDDHEMYEHLLEFKTTEAVQEAKLFLNSEAIKNR